MFENLNIMCGKRGARAYNRKRRNEQTEIDRGDHREEVFVTHKVFVIKIFSIDAFPAHAIKMGKITALDHEIWDDAMKFTPFIV